VLNLVCISKGGRGLEKTLASFQIQKNKDANIVFVLRDINDTFQKHIENVAKHFTSYKIVIDQCTSISDACDHGIKNCIPGHVLFIDGGDSLTDRNSLSRAIKIVDESHSNYALSAVVRYKDRKYLRHPKLGFKLSIAHVGFIGVVDKQIKFSQFSQYSADHYWIKELINKYDTVIYADEYVAEFAFGGISTYPTLHNLINVLFNEPLIVKVRYLARYCVKIIFGQRYALLSFYFHGYKRIN